MSAYPARNWSPETHIRPIGQNARARIAFINVHGGHSADGPTNSSSPLRMRIRALLEISIVVNLRSCSPGLSRVVTRSRTVLIPDEVRKRRRPSTQRK